jgi:hypothetical protein
LYRRFSEPPRKSTGLRSADFAAKACRLFGRAPNVPIRETTDEIKGDGSYDADTNSCGDIVIALEPVE